MKRTVTLSLLCCVVLGAWGCAPQQPVDERYQSQLRLVDQLIAQVDTGKADERDKKMLDELRDLRKEIERARQQHAVDVGRMDKMEAELGRLRVRPTFGVDHLEILFHTRATPQGITLWVAPRDGQDDAVKAPGAFDISLHRPGLLGMDTLGKKLCEWHFPADAVKDLWEGSVYRGYHLELPWPGGNRPDVETAVLQVVFKATAEDRSFSARKELRIRQED